MLCYIMLYEYDLRCILYFSHQLGSPGNSSLGRQAVAFTAAGPAESEEATIARNRRPEPAGEALKPIFWSDLSISIYILDISRYR